MEPTTSVIVLGDGAGRDYPCGTMRAVFKADGPETADRYSISEWWLEPGSTGPGEHSHDANDDVFYVLSGSATFVLDGDAVVAGPGSFVRVPPGVTHDYRNDTDEPVRLLNIYVPGGFEQEMPGIVDWFASHAGSAAGTAQIPRRYDASMRAVMLDVPESLLDERRRLGLDVFDEVWEGVLHMVPPPSGDHQRLGTRLVVVVLAAAERRGLVASHETGLFAADDDYRVPDMVVSLPVNCSQRGVDETAALVVELRSPGDESDEKLPWYAARGVAEMLIVDPTTRRFELYRNTDGAAVAVTPDDDGGVVLDTLGVRLLTVTSGDGPRLRVTAGAEITDC